MNLYEMVCRDWLLPQYFFKNRPTCSLKIKRPIPSVNIVLRTFSKDPFLGLSNKDGYHDYELFLESVEYSSFMPKISQDP